ncbi:MAG: long-chain fatty acid--CoA ligase [Alphaproteobacteria bacterium]|nr:MAG: long-chain fatty acid--CoA ligase [Alphaproteobacteria bacterium]
MNITDVLSEHAHNRTEHPAIEDGERIVTYGELDGLVDAAAANLHAAGIEPGDTIAILLDDSADHLIILCALAQVGAVLFSLNSNASKVELENSIASVPVKAVISLGPRLSDDGLLWLRAKDICQPAARPFDGKSAGNDDPLMLNQSSGTTGAPKSFLHSHAAMLDWMARNIEVQGWSREERFLCLSAMRFSDCRNISLCILRFGATVVIQRCRTMDELAVFVRGKHISYLKLTPSHMASMLEYAAGKEILFPDLRAMVVASAPVTHLQRLAARERLTPSFCEQLGSNETGPLVFGNPADQDAYPDAVGRIVEGVEAQIVDDEGRPLPAGEVGQVRFRGAGYPTHYIDDPQASARAFRGGWFYPGDLAALNEEGYLFFKGRADDIINNAGAKFYPIEVETALLEHPDVNEAAVFGWPHARVGEVAVACVVVNPETSEKNLQTFCRQRIAGYKVPHYIEILAEFPRNAMGKISKLEIKKIIERTLAERQAKR